MLADQIKKDQIAAMKAGEVLKLSVLRMLQSALGYKHIDAHRDLTDEEIISVIGNEAKKRREAIASYQAAHRDDQANQEQQELEMLEAYLPAQLSEEEVRAELAKMQLPADFGQAMKMASPAFKGRAAGGLVAKLVKEQLGNG